MAIAQVGIVIQYEIRQLPLPSPGLPEATSLCEAMSIPFLRKSAMRTMNKTAQRIDLKPLWILPLLILLVIGYFLLTVRNPDDSFELSVAVSAFVAAVSCMLCLMAVGYRINSFISILALAYMIYYPLPAVLHLMLPEPAISDELWNGTPVAMWACALGCATMAAGAGLFQILYSKKRDESSHFFSNPPPVLLNIAFFLFLFPAVILRFNLGMYDARFDPDVLSLIERTGHYNNVLAYLSRFSQMGMLLQLYRAIVTRSWKDFALFVFMASASILVFLPTGSRMSAYGWVPWFLLFYLTLERKIWRAGLVFLSLLGFFMFTTAIVQVYRNIDQLNRSFSDRLETMSEIALGERVDTSGKSSLEIVISRLSDFAFAGRIFQDTPSIVPFRESEGLDELHTMIVPKLFVNERPSLQLWDVNMDTYGVTRTFQGGGSAPPMFIGDLYSRWGWSGIVGGMFILGIVLAAMSAVTLQQWTVTSVCFYALYVQYSASLVSAGLFTAIVLLSRELFITWVVSAGIGLVSAHFVSGKPSPRRVPGFIADAFKRREPNLR